MTRRSAAVRRRARAHIPVEDTTTPGCCGICHLPMAARNDLHVDQAPAVDPDITAAERRRTGERED